jgi:hypothetical protein
MVSGCINSKIDQQSIGLCAADASLCAKTFDGLADFAATCRRDPRGSAAPATAAGASWTWPAKEPRPVPAHAALAQGGRGRLAGRRPISRGPRSRRRKQGQPDHGPGHECQSVYEVVTQRTATIWAHPSRLTTCRTFAKLAHKGRAPLEQIQIALGHASIQTTEWYLGVEQDLTDAPCDHLGIRVRGDHAGEPSSG